ncbi:MAG: SAM-dependent methyltransferase [Acidimicrobiia bacterium]
MPSCCGDEYDSVFTPKEATSNALRFRRRGLKGSALRIVNGITAYSPGGLSLLEVGGGVGEIQVALIESGAIDRAVNIELSTSWEQPARELLAERGLEGRVERAVGDFVRLSEELPASDVVVLHRVVCCYPDWEAMLTAVTAKAARMIAMTFPVNRWWNRLGVGTGNLLGRIQGRSFRGFVHPDDVMLRFLKTSGFWVAQHETGLVWRTVLSTSGNN